MNRLLLPVLGLALALGAGGCSTGSSLSSGRPVYPGRPQSVVVDVQVIRHETEIRLTNTTSRDLPAGRLWINQWYERDVDRLAIGQTVTYNLYDFHDRYGESFRGGGFFAAERPDTVVQAQWEAGDELIGLIVVNEKVR